MIYSVKKNLHTDFSVIEENKLPARSYFIPFSSADSLKKTDYLNERYNSDRVTVLGGEWDFKYFEKLSDVSDSFNAETEEFDKVSVPSTWQRTGYDQIAYINTRYAFPKKPPEIPYDVPVGIYRKTVSIEKCAENTILTFLGVAGAMSVYVGGAYIGYSEGSHNVAEFDITSVLHAGENEILVVNYKWSNGSYLECQDMFRENGIFRDVYLTERKSSHIDDILIRSGKNADGTYNLSFSVKGSFAKGDSVGLFCDGFVDESFSAEKNSIEISNLNVNEWSAEIPNLYEFIITLENADGTVEAVRLYHGFRDIQIDGEILKYNGKTIKMLGVNHHDTHMTKGYAVSLDDLLLDIRLMKEYNCNTVRTSHYPPDPAFLTMCDFYGLYVVDEADIETHGFYSNPLSYHPNRLSNDPKWAEHYLDRVKRMYERDKNHPSVTFWSLGNESGGHKCQDVCYDFLKKEDPKTPVHYEGAIRSKRWAYDVVSKMYDWLPRVEKVANGTAGKKFKGKPYFLCEYAHAMGNGPGGLEDYVKCFYKSPQLLGGCIWEWADHSYFDENAKYKYTYGGDHNEPIHDGNFCVDGLFFPNRTPSSGALEMKACYRPIRAELLGGGEIELWNTRSFKDSSDIEIGYEVLLGGVVKKTGKTDITVLPTQKAKFKLDLSEFENEQHGLLVNLIYTNKQSGTEIAREQLTVKKETAQTEFTNAGEVSEADGKITLKGGNTVATFEKKKGLVSLKKDGGEMLNQKAFDNAGITPHIYRAKLDNDTPFKIHWGKKGLVTVEAKLTSCAVKNNSVQVKYAFKSNYGITLATAKTVFETDKNGQMKVTASFKNRLLLPLSLPRFGVHFELKKAFDSVSYYGRGETENYSDFCQHALIGRFTEKVEAMGHKYIKPQDSGNRGDTFEAVISSKESNVVLKALEKPFNFNANHYTLNQLKKAKHIEDIPDCDTTYVSVDGFVRGSGSQSCGPCPTKEHRIYARFNKPLEFAFVLGAKNSLSE